MNNLPASPIRNGKPSPILVIKAVLALTVALALCPAAARAVTVTVTVGDGGFLFSPSTVDIHPGDVVEWTWSATGHSSTSGTPGSPNGIWDSGVLNMGASFSHTFNTTGQFPYFCTPHGACCGMTGVVNVADPSPTPTPTPMPTATPEATPTATAVATPTATPFGTPTATPVATPTGTPSGGPAQALNISTRMRVETGSNVLIGGFIITGNAAKTVALRGIGPSLGALGVADVLADPTLELRGSTGTVITQNDNWQDDPAQAAQLTALGLAPQDPKESGIVATLTPASYTAVVAGKNSGTGVGLVEIYDTNQAADSTLANISTRGFVRTGSNVMIGGFILGGSGGNTRVAIRGLGPSLSQFGLTPVLADPTLELHDANGALLILNDDWQDDAVSAAQLTAFGLAPEDPKEAAIFTSLPPGTFTAIVAGKSGGIGIGLAEVYNVH